MFMFIKIKSRKRLWLSKFFFSLYHSELYQNLQISFGTKLEL